MLSPTELMFALPDTAGIYYLTHKLLFILENSGHMSLPLRILLWLPGRQSHCNFCDNTIPVFLPGLLISWCYSTYVLLCVYACVYWSAAILLGCDLQINKTEFLYSWALFSSYGIWSLCLLKAEWKMQCPSISITTNAIYLHTHTHTQLTKNTFIGKCKSHF